MSKSEKKSVDHLVYTSIYQVCQERHPEDKCGTGGSDQPSVGRDRHKSNTWRFIRAGQNASHQLVAVLAKPKFNKLKRLHGLL